MSRPQFCLLFWDMWDIVWRSKFSHHFLIENLFSEFLMLGSFCTQLKVFWNRLVPCQGLTPKWAFCCGSHSCLEIYHLVRNCSRINNDMTLYSKCTTWMINLIKCSLSLDICTIKKLKILNIAYSTSEASEHPITAISFAKKNSDLKNSSFCILGFILLPSVDNEVYSG